MQPTFKPSLAPRYYLAGTLLTLTPPHTSPHMCACTQARIEDLVAANLQAKLDILHPDDLAQALHQFVEKEEKTAIAECVTRVLQQTQVQVVSRVMV